MNRTMEALLSSFAKRLVWMVRRISLLFYCIQTGAGGRRWQALVHHVVHVISDRIQVREEILTMTAEKQFEQRIMNLMPYLIVLYAWICHRRKLFSHRCETAITGAGGDDQVSGGLSAGMEVSGKFFRLRCETAWEKWGKSRFYAFFWG